MRLNLQHYMDVIQNIGYLNEIYAKIRELNRKNNLLRDKYNGDSKFVRVHKRLLERGGLTQTERNLHSALISVKSDVDEKVWQNTQMLDNEEFFNKLMMSNVISSFTSEHIPLNPEITRYINGLVVREYINEFNGVTPW